MPPYRDPRHRTEIEADRRYAVMRAASGRLDAKLVEWIAEGRRMSKLAAIGDRIAAKKAAHDRKADEWAKRLNVVDEREQHAFAIGEAVIVERESDLADLESTVRGLGNFTAAATGGQQGGSGGEK